MSTKRDQALDIFHKLYKIHNDFNKLLHRMSAILKDLRERLGIELRLVFEEDSAREWLDCFVAPVEDELQQQLLECRSLAEAGNCDPLKCICLPPALI